MNIPRHIDHTTTHIWVLTLSPLPPYLAHDGATWYTNEHDAHAAFQQAPPNARLWTTTIHATQSICEWHHVTPTAQDDQPGPETRS